MLDEEGKQRLDPDGNPMFNPAVRQQRDKKGHPLFDEGGKPVFQTASDMGYDEHGKKIHVVKEKAPKMTPMVISRGTYTVDGMIGKAERGPVAIDAIREFEAVYLIAIGGAAYLVSKAIKHSRVLAFADLGMEAIYEFEVKDMPVTVAVDSKGTSVHQTGPEEWSRRIAGIPILQ